MTHIAVIDYGMGNLHSVAKALEHAASQGNFKNTKITVANDAKTILNADKILLPGVGAMRDCMGEMQRLELIDLITETSNSKPFLGICIGMQALMSKSQENNGVDCLNIIPGSVEHFDFSADQNLPLLKIPHMGWNQVEQQNSEHKMWKNIPQNQRFYFVHSYYVQPSDATPIAASTIYGKEFTSALAVDNIFAVQFHPEKSADAGLQLFSNFIGWDGS
ncbi:MAG: imidazole glycerol phosphate synthase subunit HisH [Pseudomonadota bacterium]